MADSDTFSVNGLQGDEVLTLTEAAAFLRVPGSVYGTTGSSLHSRAENRRRMEIAQAARWTGCVRFCHFS